MTKTSKTKPPRTKPPTRDELVRQNAEQAGRLFAQASLAKGQAEQVEARDKVIRTLKGIIAELEREKAMLHGYIERDLQEKRAIESAKNPQPLESVPHYGMQPRMGEFITYTAPTLTTPGAGTSETTFSGRTERKAWHEL